MGWPLNQYVVKDDIEVFILLYHLLKCWNYWQEPPQSFKLRFLLFVEYK